MSDAHFFRQLDNDRGDTIRLQEFETGLAMVHLDLQPSEIKTVFKHFDKNGDGTIQFNEFQAALGTKNGSLSQSRWNTAPPARYRAAEERHTIACQDHEEVVQAVARQYEEQPAPEMSSPSSFVQKPAWIPEDLGYVVLENKQVLCRAPQPKGTGNDATMTANWEASLRTSLDKDAAGEECIIASPKARGRPGADSPAKLSQSIYPMVSSAEDCKARLHCPTRVRPQGAPTLSAVRSAEADFIASEDFALPVPKELGRIQSAAEKIKARKAAAVQRYDKEEIAEYDRISDLGDYMRDANHDGRCDFAEWQRAHQAGLGAQDRGASAAMDSDMPDKVKGVLRRLLEGGLASCYFFRMIDKDGNGEVTRGEFEQGLHLLKINLYKEEFNKLYDYFDKDGSGRVDYNELQKALNCEDGSGAVKPRFAVSPVRRPFVGPAQFSSPANLYSMSGVPDDVNAPVWY